ncbi:MAG: hypothetical protein JWO25_3315 [Alphaproteobacteria bacterium]|nr:hypothetical protein [Alphaproteobacteria bacterium]
MATDPPRAPAPRRKRYFNLVFLFCLLLGAALVFFVPEEAAKQLLNATDFSQVDRAERAVSERMTRVDGPPIVWIRFDQASIDALGGPGNALTVPRDAVAALLQRILAEKGARPRLVFVDIAIGAREVPQSAPLKLSLGRWRDDLTAPPLAVFAGHACSPPLQETDSSDLGDGRTQRFDPLYSEEISNSADRASGTIIWSCPIFDGLRQHEFSCVFLNPSAGGELVSAYAVPSPAWFARSVADKVERKRTEVPDLVARATGACRGGDMQNVGRPVRSRIHLAYDSLGGADGLRRVRVGGTRPLLEILPATEVLKDKSDLSALAGALVVIGGGGEWTPDRIETDEGPIPGSLLVGFAMRQAWIKGLPSPSGRWSSVALYVLLLCSLRLVALQVAGWRHKAIRTVPRHARFPVFVAVHEDVLLLVCLLLIIFFSGRLGFNGVIVLGSGAAMAELMVLFDRLCEEWDIEKPSN